MEEKTKTKKSKPADPLTYVIIFSILFVITLIVLTWTLYEWYQNYQCGSHPNIWCSDEWVCNEVCTTGHGPTGTNCYLSNDNLASCLYGPNSAIANLCANNGQGQATMPLCECIVAGNNCLSNCPLTIDRVSTNCGCTGPGCHSS